MKVYNIEEYIEFGYHAEDDLKVRDQRRTKRPWEDIKKKSTEKVQSSFFVNNVPTEVFEKFESRLLKINYYDGNRDTCIILGRTF